MMTTARRCLVFLLAFVVSAFLSAQLAAIFAQTPTVPVPTATVIPTIAPTVPPGVSPTPGGGLVFVPTPGPGWVENATVTELGRNSERARELLSWIFSHPPIYNNQAIAQMWQVSRNIAGFFVFITIIMFAIGFVLAQRRGTPLTTNFISILLKIAGVLLFIAFSYNIILLILQISELIMRFFINQVGGKDLFNIFFVGGAGGTANTEKNYTDFIGYMNVGARQVNLEMINTSMLLIRITNFTYNVMSIMLVLRHIILWFLLIISPFLALLMPFIFIRNTGWIWIGVFFQWVFYGPLFAIFLVALTKIWVAGIPYSFDFGRTPAKIAPGKDACTDTPFKTSINILYGGPAQTLGVCNSANYVDTYAEYVIALLMLWTATFLPWLLLRIFRDYCCDILAQNQAVLVQMLDRLRTLGQPPPPPPSSGPTTTTGRAQELGFRRSVTTPTSTAVTKMTEIERNIEHVRTEDIVSAMNLNVSSIQDVARLDISQRQQEEKRASLESIQNPTRVADSELRDRYSAIRNELANRAGRGDVTAKRIFAAAEQRISDLAHPGMIAHPITTPEVAQKTGVSEAQVRTILAAVPVMGMPSTQNLREASTKAGVPTGKVEEILAVARPGLPKKAVAPVITRVTPKGLPAAQPTVTVDDYEEVKSMWVNHYRSSDVPVSERIKGRNQWLEEDIKKLTNIINLLGSSDLKLKEQAMGDVSGILPFLLLGGFSDVEAMAYLKAKLAGAQQVLSELEVESRAKATAKKEAEGELVEVGEKKPEEKAQEMRLEEALGQEIPPEEKTPPPASTEKKPG